MNNKNFYTTLRNVLALCLTVGSSVLFAQVNCASGPTCTQSITLTPGWNSIYIQVTPQQEATTQVFADMLDGTGSQISSVWTFLSHRAKIDFIQDPDPENLLSQPGWLRFFPVQAKQAFMTNLHAIQANRAYLLKLEGTQNVTLTISGTPVAPRVKWQANSFNHLGFHVDPQNLPTFADFFASSLAHKEQPVYQLVNDAWVKVDPLNSIIQPDVAYWMFSKTGSDYTGPMQVKLPQLDRLEYGEVLTEFTAKLKNNTASAQSMSLQVLGNPVGMYYPNPDQTSAESWLPLPSSLTKNVAVDAVVRIPLGIRRADLNLGNFKHTLQITSDAGSRWLIPITASVSSQDNSLWVGSVTINSVSHVQNYQHNCVETKTTKTYDIYDGTGNLINDAYYTYDSAGNPIPLTYDEFAPNLDTENTGYDLCRDANSFPVSAIDTPETDVSVKKGAGFSFRVILFSEGDQVKLLKDVIQMWKKPVLNSTGDVIEKGRYLLLTDDSLISNYDGVTLRDGEIVGRRISTIAYDFQGDSLQMQGGLDGQLSAILVMAADSPTNPFRHHYHNDHKDKGYAVTRKMTFNHVAPAAAQGVSRLGIGREVIQGNYSEVIDGLHKNSIVVKGNYTLRHAVSANALNQ